MAIDALKFQITFFVLTLCGLALALAFAEVYTEISI